MWRAGTLLRRYKSPSTTPHFTKTGAAPKRCVLGFYFNPQEGTWGLLQLRKKLIFLTAVLVPFWQSSQCHHSHTLTSPGLVVWQWRFNFIYFSLDGQSWIITVTGLSCKSFSLNGEKKQTAVWPVFNLFLLLPILLRAPFPIKFMKN